MLQPGTVLSEKYEIVDTVGQGGMATVYRARRRDDGTIVAVKALREQYAHDRDFVERFQREARQVAALSHPNMVRVLGSGVDRSVHYIVMEFIEGRDLKQVLRRQGPLDPVTASAIASRVCEALDHAHKQGVIHRDVKPQNILIAGGPDGPVDPNGVKVTDFGIARAASSATITETGTVLGSVHYLSPEQAKGEPVGSPADIYSLGVVLYEMVTGQLPFEGETPIAVALKHIQESPAAPRKVAPAIPPRLEGIILRAIAKRVESRYETVAQMRDDLEGRTDHWWDLPASPAPAPEATNVMPVVTPSTRRRRAPSARALLGALAAAVIVAIGGGGYALWRALNGYVNVTEVDVPDLRGRPFEEARARAAEARLQVSVLRREFNDGVPMNAVVEQDPPPGQRAREGRLISLVISQGRELVDVPDVARRTLNEARLLLDTARLLVGTITEGFDDRVPSDVIVSQDPVAGAQAPKGTAVKLVVSKGAELFDVPDLGGKSLEAARDALKSAGFTLGSVQYAPRADKSPGLVADQAPHAGARVRGGERVSIVIAVSVNPSPAPPLVPATPPPGLPPPTPAPEPHAPAPTPSGETPAQRVGRGGPVLDSLSPAGAGGVRSVRFEVRVPGDHDKDVRLVLIDQRGVRTIFRNQVSGGERLVRTVEVSGYAILQVYMDGQFVQEIRP
jgi:serine/threonine-protein kinase